MVVLTLMPSAFTLSLVKVYPFTVKSTDVIHGVLALNQVAASCTKFKITLNMLQFLRMEIDNK
jgi:hypothetical protein